MTTTSSPLALSTELFLGVGRMRYAVASIAEASQMFCKARDASGLGASGIDTPKLYNQAGEVVGYVSYNGRVWAGHPRDWKSGAAPAYDPAAA